MGLGAEGSTSQPDAEADAAVADAVDPAAVTSAGLIAWHQQGGAESQPARALSTLAGTDPVRR